MRNKAINCKNDLVITKPLFGGALKLNHISFTETNQQYDQDPNLRLYCTQWPDTHNLQIRSRTKLTKGLGKNDSKVERNLIATITLDLEDLKQIAEYYQDYLKQKCG